MSNQQKTILVLLAGTAVLTFALLLVVLAFLLLRRPDTVPAAVAQQAAPTPTALPATLALLPQATVTAIPDVPTPTSTRVVVETITPTETPLPANCLNNIIHFESSGLMTNEEVKQYLLQTIPAAHLDNCRVIEYQPRLVGAHATPVAGSFTPMFRQIYVYDSPQEFRSPETLLDTLIHEIGHNVHYNLRRQDWSLSVRWTDLHNRSQIGFARDGLGFVSEYARVSDFEDFAETYRAYVREPELLKFANLEKYEFMREKVFDGKEYLP